MKDVIGHRDLATNNMLVANKCLLTQLAWDVTGSKSQNGSSSLS
jgi:hypothetical protein